MGIYVRAVMLDEVMDIVQDELRPYVEGKYWGNVKLDILLQNGKPETVKVIVEKFLKVNGHSSFLKV